MVRDSDTRSRPEDDTPVAHVSQAPLCVPLLPRDVSEHMTDAELAGFFCTLVDSALDAIIAHRPDGTIVYASRGACDLFGYAPAEMMALVPYGWVSPELMVGGARRIETILHEGGLDFPSSGRRSDGVDFPTRVRARRLDSPIGPLFVSVVRDASELMEAHAALGHLAYHDSLTGVGNRARFDERLALAIADCRRHGDLLGLAYIDLDEFKPVNDNYGHAVGDEVLIEVAKRLRDDLREQDTVARMGGDEFVIVLPRLQSTSELPVVAKRIVARIEEPILASGYELRIKASVGLALFDPARDDARSLVVKADVAMYAAKRDPIYPWRIYDERMNALDRRAP
jgi:diguanylate cyclase (GGDEF)-like protein/PAS domain S-box-containing protein